MYLRASKDLGEPAHTRMLVDTTACPSVFTVYVAPVFGVFYCINLPMFSGFKPNQYEYNTRSKIFIYISY